MGETYYKVLGKGGKAPQGRGSWYLPSQNEDGSWVAGAWMPEIAGQLVFCGHGYHAVTLMQLVFYLNYGPLVGTVEYEGELIIGLDKVVGRKARLLRLFPAWNERAMRLFACDCAARVLHIYEQHVPGDARLREAIAVARRYAAGQATQAELDAATDSAWSSARVAAVASATAAVMDALTGDVVGAVVWAADATDAAWAAGATDATEPAWASERAWQSARLLEYLNGTAEPLAQEAHHE